VDVDKISKVKCQLIDIFSTLIRRSQKGYPIKNYNIIKDAMLAINLIENFTVPAWQVTTILDYYSNLLMLA
jgi:hypothetical protein